jgi:hypothetical protein
MKRFIALILGLSALHLSAFAQQEQFQRNMADVNRRFAAEENILVTQTYLFSRDSANAASFDTGFCFVQRKSGTTFIEFSGVESFAGENYLVKVNNTGRLMMVAKHDGSDTSAIGFLPAESLAAFQRCEKREIDGESRVWSLSGGTRGVISIELAVDLHEERIRYIVAELAPDNPMLAQINSAKVDRSRRVFIRIAYAYSSTLSREQPRLADYIRLKDGEITPAERLRDYRIVVMP